MALRCFLFTADEGTADPIRQVLADLGIEAEHCAEAVDAAGRVTQQPFQIVIIDWDMQPEAGLLLKTTRERKASERPLTLAAVSSDEAVPQALQSGANSILRKPVLANQVRDTLTTARDLLRAKESAAAQAAAAAAAASSVTLPASLSPGGEKTLRAGEFLQSAPTAPGGQFETESDMPAAGEQELSEPVDALKELEPMAAAVPEKPVIAPPPAESDGPRGLQWYLNQRAAKAPVVPAPAPTPAPAPQPAKPELLGFDQMTAQPMSQYGDHAIENAAVAPNEQAAAARPSAPEPQKNEAQLFAYVTGVGEESETKTPRSFRLGKGTIIFAVMLAAIGIAAAPQAPWHGKVRTVWGRGRQALHAWLNPQAVTTVAQAPASHEDFGRAGDEYKLPVAENIPDAATDPSQIRVTPVVDPTAKKTETAPTADQAAGSADAAGASATGQPASTGVQVQEAPTAVAPGQAAVSSTEAGAGSNAATTVAPTAPPAAPPHTEVPAANSASTTALNTVTQPPKPQPVPPKPAQIHTVSSAGNPPIPSSLTSQMASMTPEASGNKAPETALPSIEPVDVPEAAERALATDQPAIAYPASAKGQLGTVVLEVLIGRDGTVQDAKFLQGSLAFARAAIDGVKQWKFKPYMMNGRPVSVTTKLTMSFQPAS